MNIPWPADPLRLPEPAPVVELLDGSRLDVTIVPVGGFVWDDWPSAPPDNDEAP